MSVFTSLGIIILAMLIMAFLQLAPGVYTLFYHYSLGRFSFKKASGLSLFFILGTETISACLFLCSFYLTYFFFLDQPDPENTVFAWIAVGILIALALASFICYFRPGSGTRLFIPRHFARSLDLNAKSIKTSSDAFTLGAFASISEIIFTLPLYIITSVELIKIDTHLALEVFLTIFYILIPTLPLFFIRWRFQTGHNLADIQKTRVKDKSFVRFIISLSYLVIAILIIYFRISNGNI